MSDKFIEAKLKEDSLYSELSLAEEYYRPGVWKIFYRRKGINYVDTLSRSDGSSFQKDWGPEEIKFSGEDAKERSLKYFQQMSEERTQ